MTPARLRSRRSMAWSRVSRVSKRVRRALYLTIVHAPGARPSRQEAELIAQAQTLPGAEAHER